MSSGKPVVVKLLEAVSRPSWAVGTLRGWLGYICVYLHKGSDLDLHTVWSNCQIVYIRSSRKFLSSSALPRPSPQPIL